MAGRPGLNVPDWTDLLHWTYFHASNFAGLPAAGDSEWAVAGGTLTRGAVVGAPLVPVTATNTDNSEGGIIRPAKCLQFRDDSPFVSRLRGSFTEAVTSGIANGFVGVTDQAITAALGDNGAGPAASQDGAAFYWKDGSTQLYVYAANGAEIFNEALTAANRNNLTGTSILASSANIRDWQIRSQPTRSGRTEVQFLLNGFMVARYEILTASAAMMASAAFAMSGDATNEQTMTLYNHVEAQNYPTLVGTSLA